MIDCVQFGYLVWELTTVKPLLALRAQHLLVECFSEGCDRAKAHSQSGNNEWRISPATQRAFRKTPPPPPFLPCQPTVPMPGFEGQMRKEREHRRHLRLTGSNRSWEEGGGGVWGVAYWACPVGRNAMWWQHSELSHLLMQCALLAPGPFPSSLVSSQINLLWNEHKVSGWHTHIHTFFMYGSSSDTEPCTAAGGRTDRHA